MNKLSWKDKYLLSLKEEFTIKEIMLLRDVGASAAGKIRKLALKYCIENDIPILSRNTPSIAVLEVTKRDIEFYYDRMIKEREADVYTS